MAGSFIACFRSRKCRYRRDVLEVVELVLRECLSMSVLKVEEIPNVLVLVPEMTRGEKHVVRPIRTGEAIHSRFGLDIGIGALRDADIAQPEYFITYQLKF